MIYFAKVGRLASEKAILILELLKCKYIYSSLFTVNGSKTNRSMNLNYLNKIKLN